MKPQTSLLALHKVLGTNRSDRRLAEHSQILAVGLERILELLALRPFSIRNDNLSQAGLEVRCLLLDGLSVCRHCHRHFCNSRHKLLLNVDFEHRSLAMLLMLLALSAHRLLRALVVAVDSHRFAFLRVLSLFLIIIRDNQMKFSQFG